MFSFLRRLVPLGRLKPDPLWFHPDSARLADAERAAEEHSSPPPEVLVFHHRRRQVVLRMDETFMGIGIWSDEPVVLPDDVADHNLGQSIIAELDARRVGLPSPTRAG